MGFFGSITCHQVGVSVSPLVPWDLASPMQWAQNHHGNEWTSSEVIQNRGKKWKIPLEKVQPCHPTPPPASPSPGWEQSRSWCWAGASSPPGPALLCARTSSHSPCFYGSTRISCSSLGSRPHPTLDLTPAWAILNPLFNQAPRLPGD